MVKSIGLERYVGCSGADTHPVNWMTLSRSRPLERCIQCGNVIKMDYVGPDDPYGTLCAGFIAFLTPCRGPPASRNRAGAGDDAPPHPARVLLQIVSWLVLYSVT
jgi:Cytochrome c oxidase subunit Vb